MLASVKQEPHFGIWFRRVRGRLRLTQKAMAKALGLKSYISVRDIEQRAERSMRGTTAEALLELLQIRSEDELDAVWRSGRLPDDLDTLRLGLARDLADARDNPVRYDQELVVGVFGWMAAHPPAQLREMLRGVRKADAATVARALVERVAEES